MQMPVYLLRAVQHNSAFIAADYSELGNIVGILDKQRVFRKNIRQLGIGVFRPQKPDPVIGKILVTIEQIVEGIIKAAQSFKGYRRGIVGHAAVVQADHYLLCRAAV